MNSEMAPEYTIGELAARFGLATHVLRHWEDMGLLSPARYPYESLTRLSNFQGCRHRPLGLPGCTSLRQRSSLHL